MEELSIISQRLFLILAWIIGLLWPIKSGQRIKTFFFRLALSPIFFFGLAILEMIPIITFAAVLILSTGTLILGSIALLSYWKKFDAKLFCSKTSHILFVYSALSFHVLRQEFIFVSPIVDIWPAIAFLFWALIISSIVKILLRPRKKDRVDNDEDLDAIRKADREIFRNVQ